MSVIPAPWEAEIGRITGPGHHRQIVHKTPIYKITGVENLPSRPEAEFKSQCHQKKKENFCIMDNWDLFSLPLWLDTLTH
jgi:hypothetical protein